MFRAIVGAAGAVSLLALVACSEQQGAQAPADEPPAPSAEDEAQTPPASRSDLRSEAERLAGEARRRAGEALEDAAPYLDRAGEIAGQIGSSVAEIVDRAARDLADGARMLEERINEATGSRETIEPSDPEAILSPADALNADTRAASQALAADVGPDYIGVWAGEAAQCARIDQQPVEIMAVVTPTTIRHYETICNYEAEPLVDGSAALQASCIAEGQSEDRSLAFQMSGRDQLTITYDGMEPGIELLRCHPAPEDR